VTSVAGSSAATKFDGGRPGDSQYGETLDGAKSERAALSSSRRISAVAADRV
jgi:hypothetical protein